ncbi:hypothetical protein ACFSR7_25910 [Cohnella sp. GCM10020058]|uniref:hypothetical protein n=1 Tax=Cohnella sp. GCM10020058 TaxID=3317330 RepID=UPI0036449D6D
MTEISELDTILDRLSKEELVRIVAEVCEQDPMLKNSLLLKYGEGKSDKRQIQAFKKMIASVVKKYVGRQKFIPYRDVSGFAAELTNLLESIGDRHSRSLSLEMTFLMLEEGMEALQYADDSGGDIGQLIQESLGKIAQLANESREESETVRMSLFDRLVTLSESDIFDGWESNRIEVLEICVAFADLPQPREKLRGLLEEQLQESADDGYKPFYQEKLLGIVHRLLLLDSEEEAERFAFAHIQYPSFRELIIDRLMESGDYRRVLEVAEEGERSDLSLPGRAAKWKRKRYEAYKKLSLKQEQAAIGKELLLNGEYAYYEELAVLAGEKEEAFYRGIVEELREAGDWRSKGVYLRLILEKNDLPELMQYVRAYPSEIEAQAERLAPDYLREVMGIYEKQIERQAENANERKGYKAVCGVIKRYKKIAGASRQAEIVSRLKAAYGRRPAFMEELAKLS